MSLIPLDNWNDCINMATHTLQIQIPYFAAAYEQLSALRWSRDHERPWDSNTCAKLSVVICISWTLGLVLIWLIVVICIFSRRRERGCLWHKRMCVNAACNGHLHDVLQWARENRCLWDKCSFTATGCSGHLRILRWAWENGRLWDKCTCTAAALHGHMHVLQWTRENRYVIWLSCQYTV